jgi:hypothetical protein
MRKLRSLARNKCKRDSIIMGLEGVLESIEGENSMNRKTIERTAWASHSKNERNEHD